MKRNILVIPDTHGRVFWKSAVEEHLDKVDKVVFLGDYMDPYPFEDISVEDAMSNFKEIIDFKKANNDKVVLLIGNHDFYYYMKTYGNARYSWKHAKEIEKIFDENRDCFQLVYETDQTLFSHAGFKTKWAETIQKWYGIDIEPTEESLNSLLEKAYDEARRLDDEMNAGNGMTNYFALNAISRDRGGRAPYGSIIWADVEEMVWENERIPKFQVFGHTLQLDLHDYYDTNKFEEIKDGEPKIETDRCFAMLDCRHAFLYNEDDSEFEQI